MELNTVWLSGEYYSVTQYNTIQNNIVYNSELSYSSSVQFSRVTYTKYGNREYN